MVLFTDVTAKLADSPFTVEWLLDSLSTNDKKFAILEQKYTIKNVAANDISDGKGFASKVYKVEIEFHEITEPYLVILKVPGTESLAKTSETGESPIGEKDLAYIHNKECDFYTKFAEHIDTVLPKVYKAQKWILGEQPGALLMSFIADAENMTLIADTNIEQ
uniref:SHSP domain-containing protein n=1 Tax=Steinernema glaseri TaxID=37863 RepID=A0A1I7XYP2_9BILA